MPRMHRLWRVAFFAFVAGGAGVLAVSGARAQDEPAPSGEPSPQAEAPAETPAETPAESTPPASPSDAEPALPPAEVAPAASAEPAPPAPAAAPRPMPEGPVQASEPTRVAAPAQPFAAPAATQRAPASPTARFPVRAIDRYLVLRGGVMRLAASGSYSHRRVFEDGRSVSPEQAIVLTPELEYGVWDDLTIGGVLFPVTFWPQDQLGNPSAHVRYRIQVDETAIGLVGRVHFPFADNSDWQVDAEVPIQFRLAPNWQLQTGAAARFTLADPLAIGLAVPLELFWQLARDTYVRVATGASITDFSAETLLIPVEFSTAYTFASSLGPVAELSIFVRWPEMFAPLADEQAVRVGGFEAGLGFSAYFYQ